MKGVTTKPLYEVGYHLVSSMAEDAVGAEVARLRSSIESHGGNVVSEEWPKTKQLAYPISRREQSGKNDYDTSYFGWVRFEIEREKIKEIQKDLDAFESMLRFIVLEVSRAKAVSKKKRVKSVFTKTKAEESDPSAPKEVKEEMDREIEKLIS